jgi:hypothetical protein
MATALAIPSRRYNYHETRELQVNCTLSSGQFQFGTVSILLEQGVSVQSKFVAVSSDTIAKYETTIRSLQEELRQYRALVSKLISQSNESTIPEIEPSAPLSAEAIAFLDSIIQVHIPQSAIFVDFEEGEI